MSIQSGASIAIRVNGEPQSCAVGTSLADLVARLGLRAELVAVEVNGSVVRRADHPARRLAEGDEIEVVTLVGGG